jgi:hypothetical protein
VECHPDRPGQQLPRCRDAQLSLYRTESGSLVWRRHHLLDLGASNEHDSSPYGAEIENVDIQQFVINMFADMGIQLVADAFLISQGLKRASASTDTSRGGFDQRPARHARGAQGRDDHRHGDGQ